ncbi:Gfo/Idh/MocA family protein [Lacibacterium aquatile]|uniref:Gfo/Idh/MocA family protein n=1 Tax=Lacibacterium aquatile TaxID=1168082 RepID=A0ABW5DUH4_9PROT
MKNFALIGAAGYIAPRHMKAVRDVGGALLAAYDPNDSVGVIDSHFPEAEFFTSFEEFDRFIDASGRNGTKLDYLGICSPNYLHDAHIRYGLRTGADVICEKPLVLGVADVDALMEMEKATGKKVNTILQLRLHPVIQALREKIQATPKGVVHDVTLTYLTSRGKWYFTSWKGETAKSGGIASNIGIHFFDMLSWVFGEATSSVVHKHAEDAAAGVMQFEKARVRWFLSVNADYLPAEAVAAGKRTYRSILIDGQELEFSEGFTELHSDSYRQVLAGKGYGLADARPSISIAEAIRHAPLAALDDTAHTFAARVKA